MSYDNHLISIDNLCNYSNNECKKILIILKFTATWCGPCKMVQPFLEVQKGLYPTNKFLEVDVDNDNYKQLVEDFGINAMPTFIFYKNGAILSTIVGCDKNELSSKFESLNS